MYIIYDIQLYAYTHTLYVRNLDVDIDPYVYAYT